MYYFKKYTTLLFICSLIFIILSFFLASRLTIQSNMEDMLPSESKVLQATEDFNLHFDDNNTAVIVVQGDKQIASPFIQSLTVQLSKSNYIDSVLASVDEDQVHLISNENETTHLIFIKPALGDDFAKYRDLFYDETYDVINTIKNQGNYDMLDVGLTGGAFIQDLEGDRVGFEGIFDTFLITLVLILVFILLSFRKILLPLSTALPLIGGAALTSAIAYLIFTSINMFSVSFAILLLGLGIDFSVHLMSRYLEPDSNLSDALSSTGMSILLGALTTSAAFFAFAVARFRAFLQMGVISGVGILIMCLITLTMTPFLIKHLGKKSNSSHSSIIIRTLTPVITFFVNKRRWVLGVLLITIILLIPSVAETTVISDMNKIYPDNLPSQDYADILIDEFAFDTNSISIYVDTPEELIAFTSDLENETVIRNTRSLLSFIPLDSSKQNDILAILHKNEGTLKGTPYEAFNLNPTIISQYLSPTGKWLMEISPAENIYEPQHYEAFYNVIHRATGAEPVGMVSIMYEINQMVTSDIITICLFCMLLILIMLLLLYRNLKDTLITMTPLVVTLFTTIGVMNLLGVTLNVFSVAAFPLIIGIGIDSAIHMMHRIRHEKDAITITAIASTGKAIFITTMTTTISFLGLSRINHPGMANLGLAVAIGMFICFVMTMTLIPVLRLRKLGSQQKTTQKGHQNPSHTVNA